MIKEIGGSHRRNYEDLYQNIVAFRGTLGILYEQSRMAEDGVRRPEGTIQSYKESVHHQYVSTFSNLKTLDTHSKEMYYDYWDGRKFNVSSESKYANRSFVILPTKNHNRLNVLADKLLRQDIEIYQNTESIVANDVLLQNGEVKESFTPDLPNSQPEAPLISAILEFDADIDDSVLIEEKQKSIKDGSSLMYDTTAFNLTMMYGLPAVTVPQKISKNLQIWNSPTPLVEVNKGAVMWAVDGSDDRSVAFAARLLEQNIQVRIIDKASTLSGHDLSRGSIAVVAMDNPNIKNLHLLIDSEAKNLNISVMSIESGFGHLEWKTF